jgi:hypothetical protein
MTKRTTGFGFICLLLAGGCVSTGTYQRKEDELTQLRNDSTESDRVADADRRRLQAAIDKLKGELSALSRTLATSATSAMRSSTSATATWRSSIS